MSRYSAEELLSSVAAGSKPALGRLYNLTRQRLYSVVRRIVRNASDAEDSLQETFVKVWRTASSSDGMRGAAITWMMSLARNTALDVLRRTAVRPKMSKYADTGDDPYAYIFADENQEPAQNMARRRAVTQAAMALMDLPPKPRQCVAFALFEGLSHSELLPALITP